MPKLVTVHFKGIKVTGSASPESLLKIAKGRWDMLTPSSTPEPIYERLEPVEDEEWISQPRKRI